MATLTNVMSKTPTLNKPAEFDFNDMPTQETPQAQETPVEAVAAPTAPSTNTIDTNQLEVEQKAPVLPESTPEPERFEPNVPEEQTEVDTLASENEKLRDEIKSGLLDMGSEGALTAQAEEDAGLVAKREAKTAIDNKIRRQQRDTDLALRDAQDATGTRAQKNAIRNEIVNKSNRKLADLSIIQMARGGELADAQATVDRKVELVMQDKKTRLDALMFIYGENKERFTVQEERAFNAKIKKEERAYEKEFAETKQLEDMKLQMVLNAAQDGAGDAVLGQIQGATDVESLMKLPNAGRYSQSKDERLSIALKQAQLAKLAEKPAEQGGIDFAERARMLALAKEGDPLAIQALGYDPNNARGGLAGAEQYENETMDIQIGVGAAKSMLENMSGLRSSAGAMQSPLVSGFFRGGSDVAFGDDKMSLKRAASLVPGVGNVIGSVEAKNAKMDFLSDASFLINDTTFQEVVDMRAAGVTFGNMTEGERKAAGRAANQLNSAAIVDESGNVTGFQGSEDTIQGYIGDVLKAYEGRQEYLNIQYGIDPTEEAEGMSVWNS